MRVHLIGCEGAGMKWMADHYRGKGYEVSGSDILLGPSDPGRVKGADLVVYSAAVPESDPERMAVKAAGVKQISRAEALAAAAAVIGKCIAVAGTHGKTTTACMLGEILRAYDPAVFFGGTYRGERGRANGDILIAEACEYRRGFLYMSPDIAVVLNAELDHTDCYSSSADVVRAFAAFVARSEDAVIPDAFTGAFVPRSHAVAVGRTGSYACIDCVPRGTGSDIALKTPEGVRRFRLGVPGRHNAENAAFAVAAARIFGAHWQEIAEGLERFTGVDRRLQLVGSVRGAAVYSDYAHHPSELAASLSAYRDMGYERVLAVFQPHTHERLGAFLDGFAEALLCCDSVILPVFRARGTDEGACSEDLARRITEKGGRSVALGMPEAAAHIKENAPVYGAIAVTGAGDNERLLPYILDRLPSDG